MTDIKVEKNNKAREKRKQVQNVFIKNKYVH